MEVKKHFSVAQWFVVSEYVAILILTTNNLVKQGPSFTQFILAIRSCSNTYHIMGYTIKFNRKKKIVP